MPRNPDKRPCSVPDCRAWAMRDSDPPLCSAHMLGKVGAPFGNRNALTHGFYASALHPDDLKELDEAAYDTTLNDEIIVLRIALRRLQRMVLTGLTPDPDPQRLDAQDYARFIGLIFQGINTLSRLLRVRHDLPGNDRWEEIVNWTLDAPSEEWGIEL